MKRDTYLLTALCLSYCLSLSACIPNTLGALPQTSAISPAALAGSPVKAGPRERITVHFQFPTGFRTQLARFEQIAFLRLTVKGAGISTPISSEQVAVTSNSLSVSLDNIPLEAGKLRVVTAQAFDADKNTLPAFESKAIYTSTANVSALTVNVTRRHWLLGSIVENLLSNDSARLALLDRDALQSKLESMMGYTAASQTFATEPSRYNSQALVDQIAADGSVPDASALSNAALRQTSTASIAVNTANKKPLAEAVRLLVSDPSSKWADVPSLTASGVNSSLAGVAPGTWQVEAQNMSGTRVGSGTVTVDGAGTAANTSLELSNVSLGKGEFQVNTTTANAQEQSAVAHDAAGNYMVVWKNVISAGANVPITAQRYNAQGQPQGNEFQVTSLFSQNPAIAAQGQIWVAWSAFFFPGNRIYLQRFNAAGEAQGSSFRSSTWNNHEDYPSIASDTAGNAVLTWVSSGAQDGSGLGIYARRYNAAGEAQGDAFRVNTFTAGAQDRPAVAMDSSGNFVIVWSSEAQEGTMKEIYAQRYNAAGEAQGGEFRVNTTTADEQEIPSVAMKNSGEFVVSWSSKGQDGDGKGIYAQRYNAAGVAQGSEFKVNAYTTGDQDNASVSMDNAGSFVIGWSSNGQDGSQNGIYAQRFNAAGTAQGSEFRVNTTTNDHQSNPALSLDSSGNCVAVWDSDGAQDGSNKGIFSQLFNATGGYL